MINKIDANNSYKVMFRADAHIVYPNEFICDDLERKKPDFNFLDKKEEAVPVKVKKENLLKKISAMSEKFSEFFKAAKQYNNYKKSVKLATKINVITTERARTLLKEQRTLLFNILKK